MLCVFVLLSEMSVDRWRNTQQRWCHTDTRRLTQLVRKLVAQNGQRRGQTRAPGHGERRTDRQTVGKVMNAVSNGDHVGKQTLLWREKREM